MNFRNLIKDLAYKTKLYHQFASNGRQSGLTVLCYHGITERDIVEIDDSVPNALLHLPAAQLELQIRFIRETFDLITADQLLQWMSGSIDLPPKPLLITFDDAYKNIHRLAKPILDKYEVKPIVFVPTDCIASQHQMWPDRVYDHFQKMQKSPRNMPSGYTVRTAAWDTLGEKRKIIHRLIEWMKNLENDERLAALGEMELQESPLEPESEILNEKEIYELSKGGFEIGSHSHTHPILSRMSCEQQKEEVTRSKNILQRIIGKPVRVFAYPNGRSQDFNAQTVELLKEEDYSAAFTTVQGYNERNEDRYQLKRFFVLGDLPIYEFCHRLAVSWPSTYAVR